MRGPVETHLINVQLNVQRDPYSRAVLASDVFKLLTLLTPMFTCRSLALLLPESSCSSWRAVRTPGHPQVKQVTQDVSGRAGGAGLLVRDSGEGTGSQGLDQQAEP